MEVKTQKKKKSIYIYIFTPSELILIKIIINPLGCRQREQLRKIIKSLVKQIAFLLMIIITFLVKHAFVRSPCEMS